MKGSLQQLRDTSPGTPGDASSGSLTLSQWINSASSARSVAEGGSNHIGWWSAGYLYMVCDPHTVTMTESCKRSVSCSQHLQTTSWGGLRHFSLRDGQQHDGPHQCVNALQTARATVCSSTTTRHCHSGAARITLGHHMCTPGLQQHLQQSGCVQATLLQGLHRKV
jgi:hypothetical protein